MILSQNHHTTSASSFQKTVNCFVELIKRLLVVLPHGIHDAMLEMILQDDAADALYGAVDGRKLDEHVAAVPAIGNHLLDGFEMTDEPRMRLRTALVCVWLC